MSESDENLAVEYLDEVVPWTEVCTRTGSGELRAKRAAKRGQIPAVKIGNRMIVLRQPFEQFMRGEWKPRPQTRRVS